VLKLYTQINIFEILFNQTEIWLYLPFCDWVGTKRTSVLFQNNRKIGKYNLISVWFIKISLPVPTSLCTLTCYMLPLIYIIISWYITALYLKCLVYHNITIMIHWISSSKNELWVNCIYWFSNPFSIYKKCKKKSFIDISKLIFNLWKREKKIIY